ncbi:glycoside hydrolase family 25 protein [Hymenobacter ruricola]|uniref:Glycoside hydrolase family 25 protein n=1 Tax=Hymenobacter ruricola TaxID=2791023 RepID=A0ABS0IA26_9BACT|nr:glycoside hydrolase family 25 protein [Hymenobacter ruricola]MBF9223762.1 glycoside hydrolase family 25 protein [Hymenobacter ruricola]
MIDAVVDISHHQQMTVDFVAVASSGILGVIHKATEGLDFTDPMYASRKPLALREGLLWGAYHMGHNEDGAAQAEFFLKTVQPGPTDLLALDFEDLYKGAEYNMTLQQAEDFVQAVQQATGRYPGLYALNDYLLQNGAQNSAILQQCWLWIAQPDDEAEPSHPAQWSTWTLWQHTNGKPGVGVPPFAVDGIGLCDRDFFNGSADDLRRLWGVAPAS